MARHLGALASQLDGKIRFLGDVLSEYKSARNVVDVVAEEMARLQEEKEMFEQENEGLKKDKEMLQHELNANEESLVASAEKISQQSEELKDLKRILQESELRKNKLEQQRENLIRPKGVQTRSMHKRKSPFEGALDSGAYENDTSQLDDQSLSHLAVETHNVQTRSMRKRKSPFEGALDSGAYENDTSQMDDQSLSHLAVETHNVQTGSMRKQKRALGSGAYENDTSQLDDQSLSHLTVETHNLLKKPVDLPSVAQTSDMLVSNNEELESVRKELIKGFFVIDKGNRNLGIKEIGELNEKAFKDACREKLPPEEVDVVSNNLYSAWQKQLSDLSWHPFKTVTVDGKCQEIVDVDDDKLQELKRIWGDDPHDAVVRALMEMQEYNLLGSRKITYELWNYKEGRKATTAEGAEYMCSQVKQLSTTKRRKTRRTAGIA